MRLCVFNHCARIYCLTVRCDAALDDRVGLTLFALVGSAALLAVAFVSGRCRTQLGVLVGVLLAVPCILHLIRHERDVQSGIAEERDVAALHAHRCWDRQRCLHGFSVFVWQKDNSTAHNVPWWTPPADVAIAPDPDRACAVVVPRSLRKDEWRAPSWVAKLPGWRGGRNHVFIDQSDHGTTWAERRAHLGCAALAQSHMELTNYVHELDISLPLEGSRLGVGALDGLHAALAATPAASRPYWLTFRGTTYPKPGEAGSGRTSLLDLARLSTARRPVVVVEQCFRIHGIPPEQRAFCESLDRSKESAPPYLALFNSTFALVPGGRQPASFRLNEVMAAACIPVFVSGDERTSSPYVRPFDTKVDWGAISLHFPFGERAEVILATLEAIPKSKLLRMQLGVRQAWSRHFAPSRVARTFYGLVRERSYRGAGDVVGETSGGDARVVR